MTKLLLITSPRQSGWLDSDSRDSIGLHDFAARVSNEKISVDITTLDNLLFSVSNDSIRVFDMYNKLDVSSYDVIHLRNMYLNLEVLDAMSAVATYALTKGIKLLEPIDSGIACGKLSQMMLFAFNGLPIPATVSCWNFEQVIHHGQSQFNYPYILKANLAMKGNDNYLINSEDQIKKVSDRSIMYVAQEYIENDSDYRVLILGQKQPLIVHRKGKPDTHLNNTSRGAEAKLVGIDLVKEEVLELSKKTASIVGRVCTGIDIMKQLDSERYVVLEANVVPALSSGTFTTEKAEHYRDLVLERDCKL